MKVITIVAAALLFAGTTQAQQFQRQTVEEKVQSAMQKTDNPLKLDQSQRDKASVVLTDFYTAQNKMREDARASGNRPDRSVFEKLTSERDEKLKAIFTEEQYKKFKDEVEKTLRPRRTLNVRTDKNN